MIDDLTEKVNKGIMDLGKAKSDLILNYCNVIHYMQNRY